MSHTQHTPGPWSTYRGEDTNYWWIIRDAEGHELGSGDGGFEKADAHLIATSPRLLSAAQRVTAAFRTMGQPASVVGLVSNLRAECEASMLELDEAIKQATGEAE